MQRYWPMLVLLACMWGAAYLFIKLAVEDIPPAAMTDIRLLLAGTLLFGYLASRLGVRAAAGELRSAWVPCLVLGVINAALPMTLVAWGETHIDSSVAGIAQASVPIFVAIFGLWFLPGESLGPTRVVGLVIGMTGVVLVTGAHPDGGPWAVVGTLAVVLASVSYASGGIYGQRRVHGTPGPVLAAGSMLAGGLVLLPLMLADPPTTMPGATAVAALLALTLIPTFLGQLLLFRMLRLHGSRRMSLVTFLMPGFAIVYGAVFLDEPLTAAALGGLALILTGVVLASGHRLFGTAAQESPA